MFSVSAFRSAVDSGVILGQSNFRMMRIKNRIFVVFSCIYRQKHSPTVESDYSRHPKTAAIVLELLEPLFGCGHTLWINNFFNSPELARKLKIKQSTDSVGILKLNRKNVPKEVKDKKLEKGEIIARYSGPVTVLKWHDTRNVPMVSTHHSADKQRVSNTGKETEKPLCVIDYNHNMRGVNLKDQLLHMYIVEREKKMTKWYLKLFKRLLNSTVINSFVVYREVTGRNIQQLSYRIQLVEGLFMKYAHASEKWTTLG